MNHVKLDNVQLVKHLGHIITSDLTDDKDTMHQTSMNNRKANACCQILNTSVTIYVYTLCNPTAAVFMDHSYGTYPIRVLAD